MGLPEGDVSMMLSTCGLCKSVISFMGLSAWIKPFNSAIEPMQISSVSSSVRQTGKGVPQ